MNQINLKTDVTDKTEWAYIIETIKLNVLDYEADMHDYAVHCQLNFDMYVKLHHLGYVYLLDDQMQYASRKEDTIRWIDTNAN